MLDREGQPLIYAYNRQRRIDAGIDELLGLIKGVAADGEVSSKETEVLGGWVLNHPDIHNDWPANVLVRRLDRIFADGIISDEEREDLRVLLLDIVGEQNNPVQTPTTALPLCKPATEVIFDQNTFVFTGKFAYGPRRVCESEALQRGGLVATSVTYATTYVVIGSVGSRDWIHSPWGRKIEKAVEYKPLCGVSIISEEHWAGYVLSA